MMDPSLLRDFFPITIFTNALAFSASKFSNVACFEVNAESFLMPDQDRSEYLVSKSVLRTSICSGVKFDSAPF